MTPGAPPWARAAPGRYQGTVQRNERCDCLGGHPTPREKPGPASKTRLRRPPVMQPPLHAACGTFTGHGRWSGPRKPCNCDIKSILLFLPTGFLEGKRTRLDQTHQSVELCCRHQTQPLLWVLIIFTSFHVRGQGIDHRPCLRPLAGTLCSGRRLFSYKFTTNMSASSKVSVVSQVFESGGQPTQATM